jgi:hypothetical protein
MNRGTFDKQCGAVRLTLDPPAARWATITFQELELRLMRPDDLRDLQYLIARALENCDD